MSSSAEVPLRSLACARCSRRKQKCDRKLPTCSSCRKANADCETTEAEVVVTRSSTGSIQRKGFVRQLEDRLLDLESRIIRGQNGMSNERPRITLETTSAECDDHSGNNESTEPTATITESENVDIGQLSMRALAEPSNRASEFLKELSMPRLISAMTETYGGNPEASSRADPLWDGIGKHIRQSKNDDFERLHIQRSDAMKSLETYLDVVDFRYPRLPVSKVENGISAIAAEDESLFKDTLAKDPAHIFMAYMVMAIVPLVSDLYPVSQGSFISIHLLTKSLKVLEVVFRMEDGVDIIQCVLLLVIFSIHSSAAGSSWLLIGVAMKKCIALGYHQEPPQHSKSKPVEEIEQRRWAFWNCYLLDRLISSALGRPFSISDRHITVPFPSSMSSPDTAEQRPYNDHTQLFRYAVLLSEIVMDRGNRPFDDHLGHLLHWDAVTTGSLGGDPGKQKAYLTSLQNTLLLRVIIDQINATQTSCSFTAGNSAPTTSFQAVIVGSEENRGRHSGSLLRQMKVLDTCLVVIQSLNRTTMRNRSFLSWITGYSAFSVALVALFCLANGEIAQLDHVSMGSLAAASPFSVRSERLGRGSKLDELIRAACRILDVVSRQFPRMQAYRHLVDALHELIDLATYGEETENSQLIEVQNMISAIGPQHLQSLADSVFTSTIHAPGQHTFLA